MYTGVKVFFIFCQMLNKIKRFHMNIVVTGGINQTILVCVWVKMNNTAGSQNESYCLRSNLMGKVCCIFPKMQTKTLVKEAAGTFNYCRDGKARLEMVLNSETVVQLKLPIHNTP